MAWIEVRAMNSQISKRNYTRLSESYVNAENCERKSNTYELYIASLTRREEGLKKLHDLAAVLVMSAASTATASPHYLTVHFANRGRQHKGFP